MRDTTYTVIIDSRFYEFGSGAAALEFAHLAARHMTKKSWETELPDVMIKIVPVEPEEIEAEEPAEDLEQLEKECEA